MSMMMKKLGIQVKELDGVQEIVIRTATTDYIFDEASVSIMKAQGVETWQISGSPREETHEVKLKAAPEDIAMVMDQCGCDEAAAKQALEDNGGDLAQAILALSG